MRINIIEITYLLFVRLPHYIWGRFVKKNLVKAHWGRGLNNFGDCLQPYILKHYGLTPYYVTRNEKTDVILAGSILQGISPGYRGYIIGTGGTKNEYTFEKAKVLALRGRLTYENFMPPVGQCIFGDIGLIMPLVFSEDVKQRYDLGIVLHFTDNGNEEFTRLSNIDGVAVINVLQSPKTVIHQIRQCKHIASSSLHGLIIAEAYGIPTLRVVSYKTFVWKNPDYKYEDHYSALGIEMHTHVMDGKETKESLIAETTLKPMDTIRRIQDSLDAKMKEFAKEIIQRQR